MLLCLILRKVYKPQFYFVTIGVQIPLVTFFFVSSLRRRIHCRVLRRYCSYLRGIFKLKFVTFLFVFFFKGLFSLRGCVATGIMWVKLKLNLKESTKVLAELVIYF